MCDITKKEIVQIMEQHRIYVCDIAYNNVVKAIRAAAQCGDESIEVTCKHKYIRDYLLQKFSSFEIIIYDVLNIRIVWFDDNSGTGTPVRVKV